MTSRSIRNYRSGKTFVTAIGLICNLKIQGEFKLGGVPLYFRIVRQLPGKVTPGFLLADLAGNLDWLAEDPGQMLPALLTRMEAMPRATVIRAFTQYGNSRARKILAEISAHY